MDKKEILIRLLNDGHISNDEFWLFVDENTDLNTIVKDVPKHIQDQIDNLQNRLDLNNPLIGGVRNVDPWMLNPFTVTC